MNNLKTNRKQSANAGKQKNTAKPGKGLRCFSCCQLRLKQKAYMMAVSI